MKDQLEPHGRLRHAVTTTLQEVATLKVLVKLSATHQQAVTTTLQEVATLKAIFSGRKQFNHRRNNHLARGGYIEGMKDEHLSLLTCGNNHLARGGYIESLSKIIGL